MRNNLLFAERGACGVSRIAAKALLLSSSALIGGGMMAATCPTALAADGIKIEVGGFFREAYQVVIEDDQEGEPGNERNTDGFFNDAEVHFTGSTKLDNGLEVGARVELEGENDSDQIDEAWVWFSGGFGEIRVGSDDDALANSCIVPPGGTTNFSAFSPNQWGARTFFTNSVCTGVDDKSDAQKILYISPLFYGFQLTASYTPEPGAEDHVDGVGPHQGMPAKSFGGADYDASVYLTWEYEGDDWGVHWGGGLSWEAGIDDPQFLNIDEQDFYQTGLTFTFGNFAVGGAFEYYNDLQSSHFGGFFKSKLQSWAAGGGIAYTYDAWTFGAQYSYREDDSTFEFASFFPLTKTEQQQQRATLTANYALGPGINVDGEVAYTWVDTEPEEDPSFLDDYDALEFGIGTAISF
jgi:outer membrane protein OmpU